MSQKTEDLRKGTETMEREGLDSMAWTEGQAVWRAGKEEKSKPGAENSEVDGMEGGLLRKARS